MQSAGGKGNRMRFLGLYLYWDAYLSLSGPKFRLTDQKVKKYITWVLAASEEISKRRGYNGKF
jgi:hypothetical protein